MYVATAERTGRLSVCRGCDVVINDQYILRVAPDMEWHAACLKCADCHMFLDEYCTCFVREGRTYCKRDYVRLFGAKCDKCVQMFDRKDLVMRARSKIYHLDCFRCVACGKQLLPGDEFALRDDGLYCKQDFDAIEKKANAENNNTTNINHNEVKATESKPLRKERREGKTTRVRTVLNEKQLQTLRVWYQNKRFKDKRRARIEQQRALRPQTPSQNTTTPFVNHEHLCARLTLQEKQMVLQGLSGVPMVASSPQRHDGGPLAGVSGPVDVTGYHPPWKALTEFAHAHDPDRIDPLIHQQYQQLMSQMHGFGTEMIPASEILCQPSHPLVTHLHPQQPPQPPLHDAGTSITSTCYLSCRL
ncbi:insulin gene enhancer protein ISL-1 [Hyalella azteca]|uniref:Insulin gene enhancer protein ISL-1 n=1 Tax=Hyalella azteca TaxID=294128 RepID=A0A8B7NGC6_HYAAZ|nr:insulin gene enhancer protein ISL-1 [Hyalella azteca]